MTVNLWKATQSSVEVAKSSVDVAKSTAFLNYVGMVVQEIEKSKESDPQGAALLFHITMLVTEGVIEQMLRDVDRSKQPRLRDALDKIGWLLRAQCIDPQSMPWFRPITDRMKHQQ